DRAGGTAVARATDNSGHTTLNPDVTANGNDYRLTVSQKEVGYQAQPITSGDSVQFVASDGSLTQYLHVQGQGFEQNPSFTFKKLGLIQGRVLNDLDKSGKQTVKDPGMAGVTVYLDLNGNKQLDPGEPKAQTDADGVYNFLHDFTPLPQPAPSLPQQVVA